MELQRIQGVRYASGRWPDSSRPVFAWQCTRCPWRSWLPPARRNPPDAGHLYEGANYIEYCEGPVSVVNLTDGVAS